MNENQLREVARGAGLRLNAALEGVRAQSLDWTDVALAASSVPRAMDACLEQLSASGVWGSANRAASTIFWSAAESFLERGLLQRHARTKPAGYAGDADMLRMIHERAVSDDSLGRHFDEYFQNQVAPQAVRNRADLVAEQIRERLENPRGDGSQSLSVHLIGSGPAYEIVHVANRTSREALSRLAVTLWDLDPRALDEARRRLAEFLSPDQITTRRENLNRLSRNKRAAEELRGADYIACQGFLDYLANEDLVALLSSLHQSLAPNGELMVFNFRDQASRAYMEWVGNWYLNYRREEELADLADRAGVLSESVSIGSEETGADLFLHVIRDRV